MSRVVHFEFVAEDIEKISEFYKTVFDWKINKWDGPIEYWFITTGDEKEPGINGGLAAKKEGEPNMTMNTIDVNDIDKAVKDVETNGGTIIKPKMQMPGIGWLVFIKDPDGNMWILRQSV